MKTQRAMASAPPHYRRDIDGLRALAIILVVLFHAFPELPTGGYVGVDVFFVISGYLISGILMDDLQAGRLSFLGFYARRCRRIVPALAVVLISVLVAGWFLLSSTEYAEAGWGVFGGAAFISNLLLWYQTGYFDPVAAVKPLLHLWSLGIEEQFYLAWPLLLWAGYRFRLNIETMIAVLLVASFALMLRWPQTQAFYFLPSRFWELLLGGGLAYLERYRTGWIDAVLSRCLFQPDAVGVSRRLPHIKGVLATALLACSVVVLAHAPTFPDWNALPPTAAAALFIAAGERSWVNRVVLANPIAVFIGRISFPLYLWHWPLLSFGHIIVGAMPPLQTRVALVILAVALASLTWLLIERPIQRRLPSSILGGTHYGAPGLVAASAVLLTVLGASGFAINRTNGVQLYPRITGLTVDEIGQKPFDAYINVVKVWWDACDQSVKPRDSTCVSNNPGRDAFALVGDSHAQHFIPGLLGPQTVPDGWLFLYRSACPPAMNIEIHEDGVDSHCSQENRWAQAELKRRTEITTVVLSSMTTPYFNNSGRTDYPRDGVFKMASTVYQGSLEDRYYQGLSDNVASLLAEHKRVIVMIDDPEMDFRIERCVGHRPLQALFARTEVVRCGVSRAEYLERSKDFRQMMNRLQTDHPGVLVYDPIDRFCDQTWCDVFHNGRSLYRDDDHMSVYGSRFAATAFLRWMMQQGIPMSESAKAYADSTDP